MFFYRETEGIRVTAQPYYLAEHSNPEDERYVFAYRSEASAAGSFPTPPR